MGRALKLEWRNVEDFPDYSVSNTGLVRRHVDDVILSQRPSEGGYLRVRLWREGSPYNRRVHVLVLEAFAGPRPSMRHHGAHAPDRSKHNNTLDNLRWATPEENEADKAPHGTKKGGGHHPALSDDEVERARIQIFLGFSFTSIASDLGCHRSTVARLAKGQRHGPRAA